MAKQASIFRGNLWTLTRLETTRERPAGRTHVITRVSVFPTSENLSAPVPGATGVNTVNSGTVDNRETQDVREIKPSILRAPEHNQHLLKLVNQHCTTLHCGSARGRTSSLHQSTIADNVWAASQSQYYCDKFDEFRIKTKNMTRVENFYFSRRIHINCIKQWCWSYQG